VKKQPTDRQQAGAETEPTNPFTQLNDTVLAAVAQEVGLSLNNLKMYLNEPHVEMTCPLCGKAHNKLVICQWCGHQAWCVEEHPATDESAIQQLRHGLAVTLQMATHNPNDDWSDAQIEQAVRHAYQPGGCRICQSCWETVGSTADHDRCPLYLHADHVVMTQEIAAEPLQPELHRTDTQTPVWIAQLVAQWLAVSSAAAETRTELRSILSWRRAILRSALDDS
jgi:hypothetical protein